MNANRPSADCPDTAPHRRIRLLLGIALAAVFLLGLTLGIRQIASPDIGWHLSYARWMQAHGSVPQTDPLTYTVADRSALNLQWLFQLILEGARRAGGTTLLTAGTAVLTLLFGGLMLLRSAQRTGRLPIASVPLLLLFFLGTHWEPRPHLFSWLAGSAILLILETHHRGSRRWLPLLPVVMVLWVNLHSLFILGAVILGSYAAAHLWGVLTGRQQTDRHLLFWSAVAVLSCLLNPYPIRAFVLPFMQFADIQGGAVFKSAVTGTAEFTTPFSLTGFRDAERLILLQPLLWWQLFAGLALAGFAGAWKRTTLAERILFAGFLYLFAIANKNFGYFAMVCFPPAAAGLDRLGRTLARRAAPRAAAAGLTACLLISLALIPFTLSGRLYDMAWMPHRPGTGFNADVLPVGACEFINRHRIRGRVLNSWDDGGYIAWATRQPVFIYSRGRVMGREFYSEYTAAKQPDGLAAVLKKWNPQLALVRFQNAPVWLHQLSRNPDWRMVYADRRTALFCSSSVAPHVPALPPPKPGVDFPAFDPANLPRRVAEVTALPPAGLLQRLAGSSAWPLEPIDRSSFYLDTGQWAACIGVSLDGLRRSGFAVPELLLNLGHALDAVGRYDSADPCYNAFLRVRDDAETARVIAGIRARRQHRNGL